MMFLGLWGQPLTSQLAEGGGEAASEGPELVVGQRDAVDALGDAPHGFVDAGGEGHQLAVGQVYPGESRVTAGGRCRPAAAKRHARPPKKPTWGQRDGTRLSLTPSSQAGLSAAGRGFGERAATPSPSPAASGLCVFGDLHSGVPALPRASSRASTTSFTLLATLATASPIRRCIGPPSRGGGWLKIKNKARDACPGSWGGDGASGRGVLDLFLLGVWQRGGMGGVEAVRRVWGGKE